jgi:hypothetical protein
MIRGDIVTGAKRAEIAAKNFLACRLAVGLLGRGAIGRLCHCEDQTECEQPTAAGLCRAKSAKRAKEEFIEFGSSFATFASFARPLLRKLKSVTCNYHNQCFNRSAVYFFSAARL